MAGSLVFGDAADRVPTVRTGVATTSQVLRDSAFDIELAGDQWLRRPAPSDLKVIVIDIDRASIDALARLGGGDRAAP